MQDFQEEKIGKSVVHIHKNFKYNFRNGGYKLLAIDSDKM